MYTIIMQNNYEPIELIQSDVIERMLVRVGLELCGTLDNVTRLDELKVLLDLAIEYSTACSIYGEKVQTFREDLGVGLVEAIHLRHTELEDPESVDGGEWKHYMNDDFLYLQNLAHRLDSKT